MTTIKTLLIIFLVVVTISCNNEKKANARLETFFLQDSLFSIDVNVPMELDSFYTWVDNSDYSCEHQRKYRFSNSKYPISQETGFIKLTYPDSSYRLTFSHVDNYDCQDLEGKINLSELVSWEEERAKRYKFDFRLFSTDNVEINGQIFDIVKFKTDLLPEQKYQSTLIWGVTRVDSIYLKVEYECASKSCDTFIEKMSKSLESIRLTKKD